MARHPKYPKHRDVVEAMQAVTEDIRHDRFGHDPTLTQEEFNRMVESRYPVLRQEREWHEWYMDRPYEPRMKVWRLSFINDRPWASLLMALAWTAAAAWFIRSSIIHGTEYLADGRPLLALFQLIILGCWVFLPLMWWRGFIAQARVHLDPHAITNGTMAAIKRAQAEADKYDAARRREDDQHRSTD